MDEKKEIKNILSAGVGGVAGYYIANAIIERIAELPIAVPIFVAGMCAYFVAKAVDNLTV